MKTYLFLSLFIFGSILYAEKKLAPAEEGEFVAMTGYGEGYGVGRVVGVSRPLHNDGADLYTVEVTHPGNRSYEGAYLNVRRGHFARQTNKGEKGLSIGNIVTALRPENARGPYLGPGIPAKVTMLFENGKALVWTGALTDQLTDPRDSAPREYWLHDQKALEMVPITSSETLEKLRKAEPASIVRRRGNTYLPGDVADCYLYLAKVGAHELLVIPK